MQEFLSTYGSWVMLALNGIIALAMYAAKRSIATKDDVAAIDRRLSQLEQARDSAPTQSQLSELQIQMERMRGDMKEFSAVMNGARQTLKAEQDGLRDLVIRTENLVGLLHQNELDRAKGGGA